MNTLTDPLMTLETQAWRERQERHRDWWTMPSSERLQVLTYEAGYDDGYEQAVADIAAAWASRPYWSGAEHADRCVA